MDNIQNLSSPTFLKSSNITILSLFEFTKFGRLRELSLREFCAFPADFPANKLLLEYMGILLRQLLLNGNFLLIMLWWATPKATTIFPVDLNAHIVCK